VQRKRPTATSVLLEALNEGIVDGGYRHTALAYPIQEVTRGGSIARHHARRRSLERGEEGRDECVCDLRGFGPVIDTTE
jgi:hypothetical protein